MKHIKAYEAVEDRDILKRCKMLFAEIWGGNIDMSRLNINENIRKPGKYILSFSVNNSTNEKNYTHFISMFDFIKKQNETFNFSHGRMNIYIDNLDAFVGGLEMINTSNKYNL